MRELRLEQPAVPATVRYLRGELRSWAQDVGLAPDLLDMVVLAVDEAVTNVVEHSDSTHESGPTRPEPSRAAAGGTVALIAAGRPCGGGIAVVIADRGTWRPPPPDPGHRGRGVALMGRLADRSTITTTAHGTTVRLCWDQA